MLHHPTAVVVGAPCVCAVPILVCRKKKNHRHMWTSHGIKTFPRVPHLSSSAPVSNPPKAPLAPPLALMVVFSQTPSRFMACVSGLYTITEAELSSGLSEAQRCCRTGRVMKDKLLKTVSSAFRLQWNCFYTKHNMAEAPAGRECVGRARVSLAESVLWLRVDDTIYPIRFTGSVPRGTRC